LFRLGERKIECVLRAIVVRNVHSLSTPVSEWKRESVENRSFRGIFPKKRDLARKSVRNRLSMATRARFPISSSPISPEYPRTRCHSAMDQRHPHARKPVSMPSARHMLGHRRKLQSHVVSSLHQTAAIALHSSFVTEGRGTLILLCHASSFCGCFKRTQMLNGWF
jgi:hypothetical protein